MAEPYDDPMRNVLGSGSSLNYSDTSPIVPQGSVGISRWDLLRSLSTNEDDFNQKQHHGSTSRRNLSIFPGVFSPVALSMFSTVLFLRLGFVVGQAGWLQSIAQFMLAYLILYLTILSVCAISTNGAVEGGGAYFMISRALGPEFGGSIGTLFFLANIISCALYISGCVEGILDNFGTQNGQIEQVIPNGNHWWSYLYATVVLLVCLIVCLVGGAMFARTSVFILMIVMLCTFMVVVSFFVTKPMCVPYSDLDLFNQTLENGTGLCGNYTGLSIHTFRKNLMSNYTVDYSSCSDPADMSTCTMMTFATVFAVLFSSVTGIMNGANMSGELKEPDKAIPRGTLAAATFTLCTYLLLAFLTAFTTSRELLINNYVFMQAINIWRPFVVVGILMATLSAALGNLIGASRILEALAKDQLFWKLLNVATITSAGGNPYVAVLISWFLVQLVLLIGSLNAISPLASVFFLLAYASTNLACLGMELASAPNFRPTFRYFTWHTAFLGLAGCITMCFLIQPIYASAALIACLVLIIVLHLRSFPTSWGSISQALIFHQVRKYLLMLDSRKNHVKFWRPQLLLMVSNPRSCAPLIEFVNDIKKSGLYVIGHVKIGSLDDEATDPINREYPTWLSLVDGLKVKAFVDVTMAKTVREGMHHLVRLSGLGGMKPNTICMGFYDDCVPPDSLTKRLQARVRRRIIRFYGDTASSSGNEGVDSFPDVRLMGTNKAMSINEYVNMINDADKMNKNIFLCRHFHNLDKEMIQKSKTPLYIDVWPVNFMNPDSANYFDNTQLFMLQLACILHMVPGWKSSTILRVFLCIDARQDDSLLKEKKLDQLLYQLRIQAKVQIVTWENVLLLHQEGGSMGESVTDEVAAHGGKKESAPINVPDGYLKAINELIKSQSNSTAVTFLYLPLPHVEESQYDRYMQQLEIISNDLPPSVFVHGKHPVTSTTL